MAKLTDKKVIELLTELKQGDAEFYNPDNENFDKIFYEEKKYVRYVLIANGGALEYVPDNFKEDKELVEIAVCQDPDSFEYASDSLKSDANYIYTLASSHGKVLLYADKNLLLNVDFIDMFNPRSMDCLLENGPSEFKENKDLVLKLIKHCGAYLEYLSDDFKNDYDIVSSAIRDTAYAYRHISDNFKSNKDLARLAFMQNGSAIEFASDEIKEDRDLVKIAIANDAGAYPYISDTFKMDDEIILLGLKSACNVSTLYEDLPLEKKTDIEFIKKAVSIDSELIDWLGSDVKKDPEIKMIKKVHEISAW